MDSSTRRADLMLSRFFSEDLPSFHRIDSTEPKTLAETVLEIKREREEQDEAIRKIIKQLREEQEEQGEAIRKIIKREREEGIRNIKSPLSIGRAIRRPERRSFLTEVELSAPKEKKVAHVGQKAFSSIEDLLSHMPKSDGGAESTKPLPITDDKQSPDVPHGHHEYSLTDDDVSFLVARIFDAEGRQEVLGEIREELAPKGILTPLGDGLRNINSDAFEIVFGKSVPAPELSERKREGADAYTFEKEFIEDVQRSLEEIKGHQKFGPIPVGEEHSLGFGEIRKAVERIWIRAHKSRDAASSVLQNVFEMLRDRFGDDVKDVRLFTLIGQKMSDLVEEGLSEPVL